MKKFIYCLIPLFALQLNSCGPGKAFSREAIPEDIVDPTIVTGFKNRITYLNGLLNDVTNATYDSDRRLVTLSSLKTNEHETYIDKKNLTEYEYNKDGLLTYENMTVYSVDGGDAEFKNQEIEEKEYDEHKNVTKKINTYKRYDSEGEISESTTITQISYSYDRNGNITRSVEESFGVGGELENRRIKDFTYDERQRLIKTEGKHWSDGDDFDDPEGYSDFIEETHIYEGNKITDIAIGVINPGTADEEINKKTNICEYDSRHNLTHSLSYSCILDRPLEDTTTEAFYEYNNKGLETCFRCYTTNGTIKSISEFEYRITTYCGANNDKIESQIYTKTHVNKLNNSNTDKSQYKNLRNYYDDKQRVIKQEISEEPVGKVTQTTYLFEY